MFLRAIVCGVLACGLLAAEATAGVDSAAARLLKGKTAQGYAIKVIAKEKVFKILRFEAELKCSDGTRLILVESGFLWTRAGNGGKFRDAQFGRTDSVYFRGRLTEQRLRGRVRLTDKLGKKVRCRSGWIAFNARPR
ncbi:MAG TPA: hypothetical protein VFY04_05870 [Solirubrobacterales bacterium]|nr:hypothetical protein [Solirubrobacterales bacterium]